MKSYTVEVTTKPVDDGDFTAHYRVIDAVPGTIVIEDPAEPMLVVPVDAESPMKAAQFVDGLATLVELELVSGTIYETPEVDFERDEPEVSSGTTPVIEALSEWVGSQPTFDARLATDGHLVCA